MKNCLDQNVTVCGVSATSLHLDSIITRTLELVGDGRLSPATIDKLIGCVLVHSELVFGQLVEDRIVTRLRIVDEVWELFRSIPVTGNYFSFEPKEFKLHCFYGGLPVTLKALSFGPYGVLVTDPESAVSKTIFWGELSDKELYQMTAVLKRLTGRGA